MIRRFLRVAAAAVLASSAFGPALAATTGPEPATRCIPINTAKDLNLIRSRLNKSFCLKQDIDFSEIRNFRPIGSYGQPFKGVFDGEGHTIRHLRIHRSNAPAALFVEVWGTIKNLRLASVDVKATGSDQVAGGVVASLNSFTNTTTSTAGVLDNVHVSGLIVSEGIRGKAGGLAGLTGQQTIIRNSSARVSVSAGANSQAGGLVGSTGFSATIEKSRTAGQVSSGPEGYAGGLFGLGGGNITSSYATAVVRAGDNGFAGGLAGSTSGTLKAVYARGQVSGGASATVGGLIGLFSSQSTTASLIQSYATGRVGPVGANSRVGGLIAWKVSGLGKYGYWDVNTTGRSTSSGGGRGLTTQQLQGPLPPGFSKDLWNDRQNAYPTLK